MTTLLIVLGWLYLYARNRGKSMRVPSWMEKVHVRLYLLFKNRLYLDTVYAKLGSALMRLAARLDRRSFGGPL